MKQTTMLKKEQVNKKWFLIDAQGETLGRLCTQIAMILKGKNKPTYTPHVDCGDNVIVINASKVKLTGDKLDKKMYYNHSQYLSGMRVRSAKEMLEKYPEEMFTKAVHGMMPKGKLGRKMEKNLRVFAGAEHNMDAQEPTPLKVTK